MESILIYFSPGVNIPPFHIMKNPQGLFVCVALSTRENLLSNRLHRKKDNIATLFLSNTNSCSKITKQHTNLETF